MIISPKIKWRSYISWKIKFELLENIVVVVVVVVLNVVASQKLIRIPLHLPSCLVAASYSPRSNYESDNAEILIKLIQFKSNKNFNNVSMLFNNVAMPFRITFCLSLSFNFSFIICSQRPHSFPAITSLVVNKSVCTFKLYVAYMPSNTTKITISQNSNHA